MTNFKPQIPKPKVQIVLWVGGLFLLGAIAWGIGWTAHGLFDRPDAVPAATTEPTVPPPTAANSPTATPAPLPPATSTQPPDSRTTPAPATSTVVPTVEHSVETIIVETTDRGVYDVVRRACGLPSDYVLNPDNEIVRETRQLNGFAEESPTIFEGQEIRVPTYLCP